MTDRFDEWSRDQIADRLVALESIIRGIGMPTDETLPLVADAMTRMTASEGKVLLALSDGTARTKQQLHETIYRNRTDPPIMKTIDVLICSIRKKLPAHLRLETVAGPAYRLIWSRDEAALPSVSSGNRRKADAMALVVHYLRSAIKSDGMCKGSTSAIVAGSGIKGDLHAVMDALARRKMVSIHQRPTAKDKRRPWIVYLRSRAG